ncbi:hypothetical protein JCM6882_004041 [Rhodosporidiobolus microsporus]
MSIRRILPLEVQTLILSYLVKPRAYSAVPSLPRRGQPSSRFSSTASFPSRDLFPSSSSARSAPVDAPAASPSGETTLSVFEEPTDEYDHIPLSTLDHPPAPRSPADLLLSLLRSDKHAEALELLHELQASGQTIAPIINFAHVGKSALVDRRDPAWLEWWKLAPSLVGNVDVHTADLPRENRNMRRLARRVAEHLLKKGEAEAVDWAEMAEFACILARQGQARIVAETILGPLTTYGPVELSERVFRTTLNELRQQRAQFLVRTDLTRRTRKQRLRQRRHKLPSPTIRQRVISRSIALRRWFQSQTQDTYDALLATRRQSLTALADLGRLDLAVQLVLETQVLPSLDPSKTVRLGRVLYLKLLTLTALRNRFDLFQPLYDSLQLSGRRLVRIRNPLLRVRTPFIIRGTDFDPLGSASPSARDAFTAYRYRQVVSAIEEGPFELEAGDVADEGFAFGAPPSAGRIAKLLKAIDTGYTHDAVAIMAQLIADMRFPSASVGAAWISYVKSLDTAADPSLAAVLEEIDMLAESNNQRRGYWTTATMLSQLLAGQPEPAVETYKTHFSFSILPAAIRDGINSVTNRAPREVRAAAGVKQADQGLRFPPSAYTFSVLVQALVASLERLAVAAPPVLAGRPTHSARIGAVYDALLATPSGDLNVLPRIHGVESSPEAPETDAPAAPLEFSSSLSPYTFTPFLLHHTHEKSAPFTLLSILADMTRLGLRPQLPHYALVLNSFARHGDSSSSLAPRPSPSSADLLFLLDCFSRRTTDSLFAPRASPSVVELVTSGGIALPFPGPKGDLNAKAYTGVLAGLMKRKERDLAVRVLNGVLEQRPEEVKRWGREDERFRAEVVKVMYRDRREE